MSEDLSDWRARATARYLVRAAQTGDSTGLATTMARCVDYPDTTRRVLGELLSSAAELMLAQVAPATPDVIIALDVGSEDGEPISIDDVVPSLRALTRALLAELNGRPDEAGFQLELAIMDDDSESRLDLLVHALLWTIRLVDQSATEQIPRQRQA
jgi:hypothetical protein